MADGKWIEGLTPAMPVGDAAKVVLAARFAVVRNYLPLAAEKPHESSEYVHQLRVGTRRAAAALRVFADTLPNKQLKAAKRTLRAIRRAAGDARDWDVFLASLPDAKPLATATGRPARDFLMGYAVGERTEAQVRLVSATAEAGPLLIDQCEKIPACAGEPEHDPRANFGDLATQQLESLFREFTAGVAANPTESEALHALRISGKRVRYAIEIFADCFPPALKDEVYPAVETVQELLGEVQDAVVGAERLAAIRTTVQAVLPDHAGAFGKGIGALSAALRKQIPAGKKAFGAWRKHWLKTMEAFKLEATP